ncbi:MAG: hypothetical protein KDC34_20380 [Saprospiraceae bacterium]|nr:hypothetical protein [Saprospiraceae bacterium]
MKPVFLKYLLLFAALFAMGTAYAQDYGPRGYYTFGINGGWSYQSGDVAIDQGGYGLGFTLGRSLYYKYTAPIALDIRGRFLFARQYGLDGRPSFDITDNSALNGDQTLNYLNYPANLNQSKGFVYQNHRTTTGELSAELVLKFNRLREQTNFILNLYGGIGLDYYRVKLNQADLTGLEYYTDYSNIDASKPLREICRQLRDEILDDTYETPASGFESSGKFGLMPDAGIEIGYQLSPNFAILAGHRITFGRADNLDGNQWSDPNNDWYHYTSFGLEWTIPVKGKSIKPPVITILEPQQNPVSTRDPNPLLKAVILHVTNPSEISCNINGRELNFDYFSENFNTRPLLKPGRNEVTITARNEAGMDRKKVIFILEGGGPSPNPNPPPPPPPSNNQRPSVDITNPSTSPYNTNSQNFTIRARVLGVQSKADIKFSLNGNSDRNFSFDSRNGEFAISIRLKPGRNNIVLQAFNPGGSDEDATIIILDGASGQQPTVRFTSPSNDPFQTDQEAITVRGNIEHVNGKQNVTFTVNGRPSTNFALKGTEFSASIRLSAGTNNLVLKGVNQYGSDSDQIQIVRGGSTADTKAPQVTITKPATASSTTQSQQAQIVAQVLNVNSRADIKLTVNGSNITNFSFSGSTLTATVNLKSGSNNVQVQAFNPKGSAQDEVNIRYELPGPQNPPTVDITSPTNNTETDKSRINVRANLRHITQKEQIDFQVNGKRITNYSFQSGSGELVATIDLRQGQNTIRVSATNNDGTDSDQISVKFSRTPPPVVNITSPANNAIVYEAGITLKATVNNASSKSDIQLELNGQQISNFNFSGNQLTANLQLRSGGNTIKVSASNTIGSDQDQVQVTYRMASGPKPAITFTNPQRSGATVRENSFEFRAEIQFVSSKTGLKVRLNGTLIKNFGYDAASGVLTANVSLKKAGKYTLLIEATNTDGSTTESAFIKYAPSQGPVVNIDQISQPATNPMNPNVATAGVEATVSGITGSNQIQITLNGQAVTDFNYNTTSKKLTFDLIVPRGSNLLRITATNGNSSDTAEASIDF